MKAERIIGLIHDLEVANLKQNSQLVREQELQWRLGLLSERTPQGLERLKESVEFALREELRQATLRAERGMEPLVERAVFDTIAHLMIYGRSKPS